MLSNMTQTANEKFVEQNESGSDGVVLDSSIFLFSFRMNPIFLYVVNNNAHHKQQTPVRNRVVHKTARNNAGLVKAAGEMLPRGSACIEDSKFEASPHSKGRRRVPAARPTLEWDEGGVHGFDTPAILQLRSERRRLTSAKRAKTRAIANSCF